MATFKLGRGFIIKRVFEAPQDVVFQAWTDPEFLGWFFNPDAVADEPTVVDLRVGGQWRQKMMVDAEEEYFTGGVYREIVPHERLVFNWGAVGGWPGLDLNNLDDSPLVTLVLTPAGQRTEMSFRLQLPDHMTEARLREWMESGMIDGWTQTIDRLVTRYERAVQQERVS